MDECGGWISEYRIFWWLWVASVWAEVASTSNKLSQWFIVRWERPNKFLCQNEIVNTFQDGQIFGTIFDYSIKWNSKCNGSLKSKANKIKNSFIIPVQVICQWFRTNSTHWPRVEAYTLNIHLLTKWNVSHFKVRRLAAIHRAASRGINTLQA